MRHRRLALSFAVLAGIAALAPLPHAAADVVDLPQLEPTMAFQWAEHEWTEDGSVTTGRGLATVGLVRGDERVVTDGEAGADRSPSWSPDGRSLLFGRSTSTGPDVVTVRDLESGTEMELGRGYGPAWSPDGRRIAYVRGTPGDGSDTELVITDVEPDGVTWRVVPGTEVVVAIPGLQFAVSWSPFSDRLAFTVRRNHDAWARCDAWTIDADGTDLRPLTTNVNGNPNVPTWSASGEHLAFKIDEVTWFLTDEGELLRPATNETFDEGGDWSPIAEVYALGVQGASAIALTSPTSGEIQRFNPPNQRSIFQVSWMPTGTHVAFAAQEWPSEFGSPSYFWSMPAAGGEPTRLSNATVPQYGKAVMSPGLVVRLAGATRIQTAVSLSRELFTAATDAVLAPAGTAVNALLAGPLAGTVGGPLLLTAGASLEPGVRSELDRLGVDTVWLAGDEDAIADAVADDLRGAGIDVRRIPGDTPAELSASIAALVPSTSAYAVHVADGSTGWADAVSVSALAAHEQRPILLVGYDSVPEETTEAIRANGITHVTIVGGTAVVSGATQRALEDAGVVVDRVAGRDRYATSALVGDRSVEAGLSRSMPLLTTGGNWPDSLTAGPAAATAGRVLLLIDGAGDRATATTSWLDDGAGSYADIAIAGGVSAIAAEVEGAIEALVD